MTHAAEVDLNIIGPMPVMREEPKVLLDFRVRGRRPISREAHTSSVLENASDQEWFVGNKAKVERVLIVLRELGWARRHDSRSPFGRDRERYRCQATRLIHNGPQDTGAP